jgi:hypothetical protein
MWFYTPPSPIHSTDWVEHKDNVYTSQEVFSIVSPVVTILRMLFDVMEINLSSPQHRNNVCNSIAFTICTSTFSKLCKQRRRVVSGTTSYLIDSKSLVAFESTAFKLNPKKVWMQLRQLQYESCRQITWQMSSQLPVVVWLLQEVHY